MENAFNDWDMMQSFKTKLAKITKLHYDDLWVTPCWLYLVAIAPAGALLGLAILQPWVPVSRLLKDPSTITGAHPFVGLVSHIGIVLWCMTAAICLYAGALAVTQRRTAGDASFLIAAGLLTGLLAFDDLFLFHEWIGPRLLSLNEVAILACYGILAAAYIVVFRRQIMRHGLLLFAASVLFGGTSMLADLSPIVIGYEDMTIGVIEDGAKFIAIALWAAFHIFAAWTTNRSPAGSGRVGSGARSLCSPAAAELHRPAAKEFEAFARDCVQLAAQVDTPELREKLLSMARDWMRAAMEEDDAAPSTNRALRRKKFQLSRGTA